MNCTGAAGTAFALPARRPLAALFAAISSPGTFPKQDRQFLPVGPLRAEATTGGGVPPRSRGVDAAEVRVRKKFYAGGWNSLDKETARFRMWDKVGISG